MGTILKNALRPMSTGIRFWGKNKKTVDLNLTLSAKIKMMQYRRKIQMLTRGNSYESKEDDSVSGRRPLYPL